MQVFKLDFANSKRELPLAGGAVAATERFNRLAWSPLGSESEAHPVRDEARTPALPPEARSDTTLSLRSSA